MRAEEMQVVVVEDEEEEEEEERENEEEEEEELVPEMVARVLLVEADDSTRHIIAALLRKCNYKVAATSDGLKAWEILKRRHSNIDLILMEFDLPSISGYALLTLIMEHDGCKNIPVIIMSSQDSISMVLKCMLKGAADFLIKPVRKNELKNLWRHVWRKLTVNANNPQNLNVGPCQVEATLENQPASCHSSDNVCSSQKNSQVCEKTMEGQSSCTTPYLEAESACMENMQDPSQIKHRKDIVLSCTKMKHHPKKVKLEKEPPRETENFRSESERDLVHGLASVSAAIQPVEDESSNGAATDYGFSSENHKHGTTTHADVQELPEPYSEAKDLTGRNNRKCTMCQSRVDMGPNTVCSTPELELSLRGFHEPGIQEVDDRHILNHSRASAFSWYSSNKKPHTAISVGDMAETRGAAGPPAWSKTFNSNGEIKPNILAAQSAHGEAISLDCQSERAAVPGIILDGGIWSDYGPMVQHAFSPVKFPTTRSPNSTFQREESPFFTSPSIRSDPGTHSSSQTGGLGQTTNHSSGQTGNEIKITESVEQLECTNSSALDPSGCTPCNNFDSQHKGTAQGSVSEVTDANATASDMMLTSVMEESVRDYGGNTFDHDQYHPRMGHRSAEREAALAKFRLKRQGRCFEKKVRYQSRKRLAEQRPRVKGQFVRQVPNNKVLVDANKP